MRCFSRMPISNVHKSMIVMNSIDTPFSRNVFEAVQKTRSTCFIECKTSRLRLVVLNPIKRSCSFFKHYLNWVSSSGILEFCCWWVVYWTVWLVYMIWKSGRHVHTHVLNTEEYISLIPAPCPQSTCLSFPYPPPSTPHVPSQDQTVLNIRETLSVWDKKYYRQWYFRWL